MPAAARVGDQSDHPGVIVGPGVPTVLIEGKPAVVVGDTHACHSPPPALHPATPIVVGSKTVLIGGRPAGRVGDHAACGATVVTGAETVIVGD